MNKKFPSSVTQYFWGDDLNQLSWPKHQTYIIKTLLQQGNLKSLKWLFQKKSKSALKKFTQKNHLDSKSKNFWAIYLN